MSGGVEGVFTLPDLDDALVALAAAIAGGGNTDAEGVRVLEDGLADYRIEPAVVVTDGRHADSLAQWGDVGLILSAPREEKDHAFLVKVFSIDEQGSWVDAARGETERCIKISGLPVSSYYVELNLFQSGKRIGKIDGFGQEGLSEALSLLFRPDIHAPDVPPVLLLLPIYSAEPHHAYQLFLTEAPSVKLFRDSAVRRRRSATNSKEYALSRS